MPAVSARGRRRRTINEINMVPFIDVMLVLLIIFMVSAPLITTGVVDLPSVGKARRQPERVVEIVVGSEAGLRLRINGKDASRPSLKQLAAAVRDAQAGSTEVPVVIAAEKSVAYDEIIRVMDVLQRAGVPRVGLAVKTVGG